MIVACVVRQNYYESVAVVDDDPKLYGKFHIVQHNEDATLIQRFKFDGVTFGEIDGIEQ